MRARGGCGHAVPLRVSVAQWRAHSTRASSRVLLPCVVRASRVSCNFSMRQTRIRYANYLRGLNKRRGKQSLALRCALKVLITFSSVGALALRAPVRARRARKLARGGERQPLARHRLDDQLEEVLVPRLAKALPPRHAEFRATALKRSPWRDCWRAPFETGLARVDTHQRTQDATHPDTSTRRSMRGQWVGGSPVGLR